MVTAAAQLCLRVIPQTPKVFYFWPCVKPKRIKKQDRILKTVWEERKRRKRRRCFGVLLGGYVGSPEQCVMAKDMLTSSN